MEINEEKLVFQENITFLTKHYQPDNFASPRHYHLEYEIAYIEQSEGKLYVGNNIVDYKPGSLFLFAPKLVHGFKDSSGGDSDNMKAMATIILFKREFLGASFLERKEAFLLNKILTEGEAGIQFSNPSKEVISFIKRLSFNEGLKSILDLLTILDYLSKCNEKKLLSAKWARKYYYHLNDSLINCILDYMETNYAKETVFSDAVKMSGMRTTSFSRYFRNRTQKTFTQYINGIRIKNAKKLLVNTDLKISEICALCGYNNMTYFNRIFKLLNNVTPRAYRNLHMVY
ncbi:MAG: helix-turn-helix domain-containing protein [Bacteroidota bacterium]